eukprot:TRINITY_DN10303_c0_g1_i1.p2 TRINITY_DN10303_c0_g1~~TRINITY_DN10303_c0_g1_i1.p2  ORF type:complete len:144 (-),score=0.43 TRINITY_DN10303_c0_g1_i1:1025-1456(-)
MAGVFPKRISSIANYSALALIAMHLRVISDKAAERCWDSTNRRGHWEANILRSRLGWSLLLLLSQRSTTPAQGMECLWNTHPSLGRSSSGLVLRPNAQQVCMPVGMHGEGWDDGDSKQEPAAGISHITPGCVCAVVLGFLFLS